MIRVVTRRGNSITAFAVNTNRVAERLFNLIDLDQSLVARVCVSRISEYSDCGHSTATRRGDKILVENDVNHIKNFGEVLQRGYKDTEDALVLVSGVQTR